jgi:hypothetical protein
VNLVCGNQGARIVAKLVEKQVSVFNYFFRTVSGMKSSIEGSELTAAAAAKTGGKGMINQSAFVKQRCLQIGQIAFTEKFEVYFPSC